jgi:hypothetical protein
MHVLQPGTPVEFQMGDATYRLRFTLRALKQLEHEHKISVLRGPESMVEAIRDPGKLALVLFYGLQANHPEITLDWVEDNFDASMLVSLAPVIGQAVSGRKVELEDPNASPPSKPNGIGLLSGRSEDTM